MGHSHQGLGSLLIKPSVWAGQAPAAHPGHGRFRLKARMKRPGGYRATFPGQATDTYPASRSRTSHNKTHRRIWLTKR